MDLRLILRIMTNEQKVNYQENLIPSEFVIKVTNKFIAREGVFSEFRNVEDYVPKEATQLEQSLFLFYVVQLDYAIKGRVLYAGATKLYQEKPEFFASSYIQNLSDKDLFKTLTNHMKPRYPNEAVARYKSNSKKLQDEYNGNPIRIFTDSNSAKETINKIQKFRGMGPKTGNLFFRSMVSTFNFKYDDIDSILQPVDIHDVRIAYLMKFVQNDDMSEKNIQKVKLLWNKACKEAGVNWITFDRALWLLGSEGKPKTKQDILELLK